MITAIVITLLLIIIYLLYPLWLCAFSVAEPQKDGEECEIDGVSLILITLNGEKFLNEKINFLIKELSRFENKELIIIDDCSTDETSKIINCFKDDSEVRIIQKKVVKGIPDSMNLGVKLAKYNNIVFCDQRQTIHKNALKRLLSPLADANVGAVSCLISSYDNRKSVSFIRMYENYLKSLESRSGNLIGVYGPFYALRKENYIPIPEDIILDDLYLSLKILPEKQIVMAQQCIVTDTRFGHLYDYNRVKRYLNGFLQILKDRELMRNLSIKQKVMLIWHKYLRLLIPVFVFFDIIAALILFSYGALFLIMFICLMLIAVFSFVLNSFKSEILSFVRINIFYIIAFVDILKSNLFVKK